MKGHRKVSKVAAVTRSLRGLSKLRQTEDIEFALFDYFHVQRSTRCALEVNILVGRVDFVALSKSGEMTCIEIKVTKSDFKSDNGHNLIGNKNYYAIPPGLYESIKDLIPNHVGVMEVHVDSYGAYGRVTILKNSKKIDHKYPKEFVEKIKDNMWIALNSNNRRLLRERYLLKSKHS